MYDYSTLTVYILLTVVVIYHQKNMVFKQIGKKWNEIRGKNNNVQRIVTLFLLTAT